VPFGAFLADAPTCVLGGIVTILFCSIMVSGIKILGRCPKTVRNHLIMSISLGIGLGVSSVPHMLKGGGNAAFYGGVMEMNMGLVPRSLNCEAGTQVYYSSVYPVGGPFGTYFSSSDLGFNDGFSGMTNASNGFHRGKYLLHPNSWVMSCTEDLSKKAWRTSFLLMFNTPYCVGFIVAMILNLVLPSDEEAADDDTADKSAGTSTASA